MKLRRKIMLIFLIISILPLSLFGLFSVYETNKKINSMTDCNLKAISENQIANIENFAKDRKSEMEMIAHYDLTADAIDHLANEEMEDRNYLDNLLSERKKYGTYVASISVMNRDFQVVGSSEKYEIRELSQLKNIDKKFHTGQFIMGNVYERVTDNGNKKLVPAYIGIYKNDELIGYIAEELDTAYFDELRLNMDSLASGTFYLLDGQGAIITAGDTRQKESIHHFVTTDKEREDFQTKWEAIDHNKHPTGEIRYRYLGDDYITYYSNLENTDWSIRVTENYSSQKESIQSFRIYYLLVFILLVIGAILIQSFFAQQITFPIQNAMQAFEQIKRTQDYSIRLETNQKDEFSKLAISINELLDYIEKEKNRDQEKQKILQAQAEKDSLTNIKNKKTIENTILEMVEMSKEKDEQITLGFLDIDHFKDFNTYYGHQVGDKVLQFVSAVLKEQLKGEIGRVGGDEFIFCFVGKKRRDEIEKEMNRLLQLLKSGFYDKNSQQIISVSCSIGIAIMKGKDADYTELIRLGDKSMYEAKDAGRNSFIINELD